MIDRDLLTWLQKWYALQCNGDWEHLYGITIITLDNPGWKIEIDLAETELAGLVIETLVVENGENDWFIYSIEGDKFVGRGDIEKLEFLLFEFRKLVERGRE